MAAEAPVHLSGRASDAERDEAIRELREGSARGRITHDSFIRRMDLALRARSRGELSDLLSDLPPQGWLVRRLTDAVGRMSAVTARLEAAWREPRLPCLPLSARGQAHLVIGRDQDCDMVLSGLTVSRHHADLRRDGVQWILADLGSMNGTRVNGVLLKEAVEVRAGDRVSFGTANYRFSHG